MTLPMQKDIELPLLQEIEAAGGQIHPQDAYLRLQKYFPQITHEDLLKKTKSGQNTWTNSVQFARQKLVEKSELYRSPYGVWRITDKGRERLRQGGGIPPKPPEAQGEKREKPSTHDELVQTMKQIGEKLGKTVEVDCGKAYKYPYDYDNLWRANQFKPPQWVIEICDKGSLDKDIASLKWANENLEAKCIWLIVDRQDFATAQKKLTGRKQIYIVEADTMRQLHSLLQANADFLRTLFG